MKRLAKALLVLAAGPMAACADDRVPPIDQAVPRDVQTATFALG